MKQRVLIGYLTVCASAFILSACGAGDEEWGVDNGSFLPTCSSDPTDASVSITVPDNTKIVALVDGTTMRVWHYDNGDKQVCVITGEAAISGEVQ